MTDSPPDSRDRLAAVIRELGPAEEPPWADSRAGRLVERWIPGGPRALAGRHRFVVAVAVMVLVVVISTVVVVVVSGRQPQAEPAPALPPAISAGPASQAPSSSAPESIVVSVVGRVARPGLVTLASGSRVADAISAAGGTLPGTNDLALDLARRLNDGEQLYVGIPIPPDAAAAAAAPPDGSSPSGAPIAKIDLNTATDEQLQTLPGVGPAMAQHILDWRSQHGHFDSISQLKDVSGIGDGRFAKLKDLVTP